MHGLIGKLFVAALLTLCVGIHVLELSGRWDQTFRDANDEAGIVAVVLCIGVAVSVAGTILKRFIARTICRRIVLFCPAPFRFADSCLSPLIGASSPPLLPLRV